MKNKAIFLDRDGTINVEKNYLYKIEDFEFEENVIKALKKLQKEYILIVVTNQAGIAKGIYNEADLLKLHNYVKDKLNKEKIEIKDFYYCPHHPDGKEVNYIKRCNCRKPENGMLINAIKKYNIDISKSWMIGDKKSDIDAGIKTGLNVALVLTGYGESESKLIDKKVKRLKTLDELANFLIK